MQSPHLTAPKQASYSRPGMRSTTITLQFLQPCTCQKKPRSGRFNECRSTNNCTHISETLTNVKPNVSLPAAINCCHRHPVNHTHHYRRSTPVTVAASSARHLSDSRQPTDSFSFSPTPTSHFCAHFFFFPLTMLSLRCTVCFWCPLVAFFS